MAKSMWRQTQQERWRGWLMFIQHCILLALQAGCLSSLPSLMRTICPTGGEAPSTRYVENSDQRLHLLLSFCLSLLQLHTLCTPALWKGFGIQVKKKELIFHSASTLTGHSWTGMFGILVCTAGAEIHPVGTLVKNEWRDPSWTWDSFASYFRQFQLNFCLLLSFWVR